MNFFYYCMRATLLYCMWWNNYNYEYDITGTDSRLFANGQRPSDGARVDHPLREWNRTEGIRHRGIVQDTGLGEGRQVAEGEIPEGRAEFVGHRHTRGVRLSEGFPADPGRPFDTALRLENVHGRGADGQRRDRTQAVPGHIAVATAQSQLARVSHVAFTKVRNIPSAEYHDNRCYTSRFRIVQLPPSFHPGVK